MIDQVAVCEFSTSRWSFLEDVKRYSAYGFDGIGIWRRKVEDIGLANAVDLLHTHQLSVSSVHWAGCFTGCDGRSFDDCLDDSYRAIRLASIVGADSLIVHPGMRNNHTTKHATRLFTSGLDLLVDYAADYDVRLAIEPMMAAGRKNWTFLDSLESNLEIASRYSSQQVGIVLDLYHLGLNRELESILPQLVPRIALVQLADRQQRISADESRCLPEDGCVPLDRWVSLLRNSGYKGFFEFELHGSQIGQMDHFEVLDQVTSFVDRVKTLQTREEEHVSVVKFESGE